MRNLLDGPVRSRAFWLTIFAAVVSIGTHFGVELGQFQVYVDQVLSLLVLIGVLHATTGTTPVDPVDRAWSLESLAAKQAEREEAFGRLSQEEIEGEE